MSWHHVESYKPSVHMNHSVKIIVVVLHAYKGPLFPEVLAQLFLVSGLRVVYNFFVDPFLQYKHTVLQMLFVRLLQS